ncbi:hypothetical protein C0J52_27635 [Blattella germanica]|nr:hypothetical protein C0J52_27635 [Blattella germanica]
MLEVEGIKLMQWPACSSGLNPIKHVWDALGMRITCRPAPPTTAPELHIALMEEWPRISQELVANLIASISHSCEALLAVR